MDRESCTYTYVLADEETKEAVIIDPVLEMVDRDIALIQECGLTLKCAVNTHVHADHITGTGLLKQILPGVKSVLGAVGNDGAKADVKVTEVRYLTVVCVGTQENITSCIICPKMTIEKTSKYRTDGFFVIQQIAPPIVLKYD